MAALPAAAAIPAQPRPSRSPSTDGPAGACRHVTQLLSRDPLRIVSSSIRQPRCARGRRTDIRADDMPRFRILALLSTLACATACGGGDNLVLPNEGLPHDIT